MATNFLTLGSTATNLAAHLREHFPVEGEPTPPSGGPTAFSLIRMLELLRAVQSALPSRTAKGIFGWADVSSERDLDILTRIEDACGALSQHLGIKQRGRLKTGVFHIDRPLTVAEIRPIPVSIVKALESAGQKSAVAPVPSALAEPPTTTPEPGDGKPSPRGVAPRNRVFLTWYESVGEPTYHSHAAIRDRWNKLSTDQQADICPGGTGKVTRDTIIQVVKRAKSERGDKPVKARRRRRNPKRT